MSSNRPMTNSPRRRPIRRPSPARLQAINDDVTELNRELADNMRKLSEAQEERVKRGRLADLGQLTAALTRELRNPLGAVRTSAYLLSRILKDRGPGRRAASRPHRQWRDALRSDHHRASRFVACRFTQSEHSSRSTTGSRERVEQEAARLPANLRFECNLGLGALEAEFDPQRLERAMGECAQQYGRGSRREHAGRFVAD